MSAGMTPGDPLGGAPSARPAARGYGDGPVPPGAFVPRPQRPPEPAAHELAGWGQRVLATLVDFVIVGLVPLALFAAVGFGVFGDDDVGAGAVVVTFLAATVVFALVALVYAPLVMARTNGSTLGKLVAGCRVVRGDGRRVGFWWAALREVVVKGIVVGVLSSLTGGIAYLIDVLWPLWDRQHRALHDFVVDSRVVKR